MFAKCIINRYLYVALLSLWALAASAEVPPTTPAVAGTWQPRESAFARVSTRQQRTLSLPFAARIMALEVEPGARVAAGNELARFNSPLLKGHLLAWQQARREFALARKQLQVLGESEKGHAITRRERVAGEQALSRAQGDSDLAWQTLAADLELIHQPADEEGLDQAIGKQGLPNLVLNLSRLRAPFAGVVTARPAALNEQLAAGDAILELEALERVYLDVGVPEASLTVWQAGETYGQMNGRLNPAPIALEPVDGLPLYDADSGLWLLRFEADNPDLALRDGAWIEVEHLGAPEPVVWVPAAAVVSRDGKTWCIVQYEGELKPFEVEVGLVSDDGRIPVITGLQAGAQVVTEGAYELLYRDLKELIKFVD